MRTQQQLLVGGTPGAITRMIIGAREMRISINIFIERERKRDTVVGFSLFSSAEFFNQSRKDLPAFIVVLKVNV